MKKVVLVVASFVVVIHSTRYEPTWESIDSRPLPDWYDEAKIGIFVHWGVYSVPSFITEWFWNTWKNGNHEVLKFMKNHYPPGFTYQEFAREFKAEFYDPHDWAKLFQASGAKYVVLTSKHHEGYTLWPSKYSFNWNSKDVGPHRDLVGDLAKAVRKHTELKFGLYHSLYEWYNPLFLDDKKNNWTTDVFVQNKVYPELLDIVDTYRPEIVWSDGDWEAPDYYWKSKQFLAWLYNDSPVKDTVVTNDRWGKGVSCKHGGFLTCDDRFNPGKLQPHKWENAMTIDRRSWGYRRNAAFEEIMSIYELLVILAQTVSCGGNLLMNVGPTKEGTIIPIFRERLLQMGDWLKINGEAIYSSKPWIYQKDTVGNTWYTAKPGAVYAIVLDWPERNLFTSEKLAYVFRDYDVRAILLGETEPLEWNLRDNLLEIMFPDAANSEWVWVIKVVYDDKRI